MPTASPPNRGSPEPLHWPPPGAELPSLLDLPASNWRRALVPYVDAPYRGDQVADWVFRQGVFGFSEMTNLPLPLRESLDQRCTVTPPRIERFFTSVDGTRRYLLELEDERLVEAVAMPYDDRVTLCISSQVGCRLACGFCQTGLMGLQRSLTTGEIVGQVLRLRSQQDLLGRPVNVVFMGQGEPLDNVDAVIGAVVALQDEHGPALGWSRVTVSTVGVVPGIRRLAALGDRRPRMAISLNATTDEVRSEIMPINRRWPIAELIESIAEVSWRKRERVTFEYVLLAGVNDSAEDAKRLGTLLDQLPAKVNLIPWNTVPGMPFRRPSPRAIETFRRSVLEAGLDALVRYSRGADIAAACGQLHAEALGPRRSTGG